MPVSVGVGVSRDPDPVVAFAEAARAAGAGLAAPCDLALVFAGPSHLTHGKGLLAAVAGELAPPNVVGCGAGGVVGGGEEIEEGPGAVVWALSAPEARISTHHLRTVSDPEGGVEVVGLPEAGPPAGTAPSAMIVLCDPYSFRTEALLAELDRERPAMPVLGGLASAAAAGSACLFRDGEQLDEGAVACTIAGIQVLPCVAQGAEPVGPEMTITAARGHVIGSLASMPAIARLEAAIAELGERERRLAAAGLLLGIVIDPGKPEYERGDFLVRPIIGADEASGSIAIGEHVAVGQTVRMHVRDAAAADEDLREALRTQALALGGEGAAGALLFTCNGRGSRMFEVPDHDARAVDDALGVPAAGFFCAGEIGPVGGRNFLHGFTATLAVFAR